MDTPIEPIPQLGLTLEALEVLALNLPEYVRPMYLTAVRSRPVEVIDDTEVIFVPISERQQLNLFIHAKDNETPSQTLIRLARENGLIS
jgi:hypothetical protein